MIYHGSSYWKVLAKDRFRVSGERQFKVWSEALGDKEYYGSDVVITEKRYSTYLRSQRVTVERTIGRMKI